MPEDIHTTDQLINRLNEAMKMIDENDDIDKFTKYNVLTIIEEAIIYINELSRRAGEK